MCSASCIRINKKSPPGCTSRYALGGFFVLVHLLNVFNVCEQSAYVRPYRVVPVNAVTVAHAMWYSTEARMGSAVTVFPTWSVNVMLPAVSAMKPWMASGVAPGVIVVTPLNEIPSLACLPFMCFSFSYCLRLGSLSLLLIVCLLIDTYLCMTNIHHTLYPPYDKLLCCKVYTEPLT